MMEVIRKKNQIKAVNSGSKQCHQDIYSKIKISKRCEKCIEIGYEVMHEIPTRKRENYNWK